MVEFSKIIVGVAEGDKALYEQFVMIVKSILLRINHISKSDIEDIIPNLVEKILLDNRRILSVARSENINYTYLYNWIKYNANDYVRSSYKLKAKERQEVDFEENESEEKRYYQDNRSREILFTAFNHFLNSNTDSDIEREIEEFYVKSFTKPEEVSAEDKEFGEWLCAEIIKFLSNVSLKEQKVFCAYAQYIEKPAELTQANYNQIFRRLKEKLIGYISSKISDLSDIANSLKDGAFSDCSFEKFCKNLKDLGGAV